MLSTLQDKTTTSRLGGWKPRPDMTNESEIE